MDQPPLTIAHVKAEGTPARWALFLHGILGSGANWRTIARRFVAARPEWGVVLVDLRMHGGSQNLPPPHTVEACANDLVALEPFLEGPIGGVLGHSFGGKVALAWAEKNARRVSASHLWLVDSNPGPRLDARGSESTVKVVETLAAMPEWYASRPAFVEELKARGFDSAIAQWLAMNVERVGERFRFGLDLDAVRAMLDDYFARDLWPVLESPPCRIVVINGGRSNVWGPTDKERVAALAARDERIEVHAIAQAGHWVHADAPDALLSILVDSVEAAR